MRALSGESSLVSHLVVISNFTITFPTTWGCAGDIFFEVLLKFKIAATVQLQFFGGRKNSKNYFSQFFLNFNIKFPATCGCASDF